MAAALPEPAFQYPFKRFGVSFKLAFGYRFLCKALEVVEVEFIEV